MFPRTVSWSSSIEPTLIVTADFNGDGRPDVAMSDSDTIVVRLTRSDGTFGPEQIIHHTPANDDSISGVWSRRSPGRSEEHTSELQSHLNLVCRPLLVIKKRS